jgi:hypothetical protein
MIYLGFHEYGWLTKSKQLTKLLGGNFKKVSSNEKTKRKGDKFNMNWDTEKIN